MRKLQCLKSLDSNVSMLDDDAVINIIVQLTSYVTPCYGKIKLSRHRHKDSLNGPDILPQPVTHPRFMASCNNYDQPTPRLTDRDIRGKGKMRRNGRSTDPPISLTWVKSAARPRAEQSRLG